jgi:hypothetical protein
MENIADEEGATPTTERAPIYFDQASTMVVEPCPVSRALPSNKGEQLTLPRSLCHHDTQIGGGR